MSVILRAIQKTSGQTPLQKFSAPAGIAPRTPVRFRSRPGFWIPLTVNLLLVLVIAYDAFRWIRSEWQVGDSGALVTAPGATPAESAKPVTETDWNHWHPFGRGVTVGSTGEPSKAQVPEDAPESRLNLTLTGVLASHGAAPSRILVKGSGGEGEKIFASGQTLPGDAKIASVRPDRVILEKNGHFETLKLPRSVVPLDGKSARAAAPPPPSEAAITLGRLQEQFQTQPDVVLGQFVVVPVNKDGVFGGYALQSARDPELLEKLGLVPGDVITKINGVALTSPMKGVEALASLGKSQSLHLTLLRGGKSMTIQHAIGAH